MSRLKLGQTREPVQTLASTIYATSIFQFGFACLNSLLAIYLLQEVKYYASICIWLTVPDYSCCWTNRV